MGRRTAAREEEEEHLGQVVYGDGEEENHGAVEKQFAQTNQQASCLQTRLDEKTRDQSIICNILNTDLHV